MAENFKVKVSQNFNKQALVDDLVKAFEFKGYTTDVAESNNETAIKIEKNTGGIYMIIGMVESVRVKLKLENGELSVNFTDVEYTSKIIAFAIGWFFLWFLWIPAIIGLVNQNNLNKGIAAHIKNYAQSTAAPAAQPVVKPAAQPEAADTAKE